MVTSLGSEWNLASDAIYISARGNDDSYPAPPRSIDIAIRGLGILEGACGWRIVGKDGEAA